VAGKYASLDLARARTQAMMKRIENPKPVLDIVARKLQDMIRASFDAQRSPAGQQWRNLAPSTLAQRKPGEFRTPLKKTGQTYARVRVFVSGGNRIVFVFPAHLLIHAKAKGDPLPKRNALPFEKQGGRMVPIPKVDRLIRQTLREYLETGRVVDLPLAAE
jgi:hypothetical protein